MNPILPNIGRLSVFVYGFFIAAGLCAGIMLAKKESKRSGLDQDDILNICFYLLLATVVGSRLFYVILNPALFFADPLEIIRIWNGGIIFPGGFIIALFTGLIYLKKTKMPLWITADTLSPSIAIVHFLGGLGCLFAGCCFEKPYNSIWVTAFTLSDSLVAPKGLFHSAQLYLTLNNLIILGILMFFRRYQKFDGQVLWIYVSLYGISRLLIQLFRGSYRVPGGFGVSEIVWGAVAVTAFFMLIHLGRPKGKMEDRRLTIS